MASPDALFRLSEKGDVQGLAALLGTLSPELLEQQLSACDGQQLDVDVVHGFTPLMNAAALCAANPVWSPVADGGTAGEARPAFLSRLLEAVLELPPAARARHLAARDLYGANLLHNMAPAWAACEEGDEQASAALQRLAWEVLVDAPDAMHQRAARDYRVLTQQLGGCTPLHLAAALGCCSLAALLADCGARLDCELADEPRYTPLELAVLNGHLPAAGVLLDAHESSRVALPRRLMEIAIKGVELDSDEKDVQLRLDLIAELLDEAHVEKRSIDLEALAGCWATVPAAAGGLQQRLRTMIREWRAKDNEKIEAQERRQQQQAEEQRQLEESQQQKREREEQDRQQRDERAKRRAEREAGAGAAVQAAALQLQPAAAAPVPAVRQHQQQRQEQQQEQQPPPQQPPPLPQQQEGAHAPQLQPPQMSPQPLQPQPQPQREQQQPQQRRRQQQAQIIVPAVKPEPGAAADAAGAAAAAGAAPPPALSDQQLQGLLAECEAAGLLDTDAANAYWLAFNYRLTEEQRGRDRLWLSLRAAGGDLAAAAGYVRLAAAAQPGQA